MGLFRKRREFFVEETKKHAESISKSLLEANLERAEQVVRDTYNGIVNGDYHNGYLREILPVMARADEKMKEDKQNLEKIKEDCTRLIESLEGVRKKQRQFDKMFDYIAKSPWANDYVLYVDNSSNTLILLNGKYNTHNQTFHEYKYPAVVYVDLFTNEVSQKYLFQDMWEDVRFPRNSMDMMEKYKQGGTNLSFSSPEDIAKVREMLNNSMNNSAELIQNAFEQRRNDMGILSKEYRTKSVFDTALDLVAKIREEGNHNVMYFPQTQQISFYSNNNAVVLNYCEEGISSAYFATQYGNSFKVFDTKEFHPDYNGFLNLADSTYRSLIGSEAFARFMGLEGLKVTEVSQEIDYEFKFIGERKYQFVEVGNIEPTNTRYLYGVEDVRAQEKRFEQMYEEICSLEQMYRDAHIGVKIDYNPYNNSINIEYDGNVLTLLYAKDMRGTVDVYYKKQYAEVHYDDAIVIAGKPISQKAFLDEKFRIMYEVVKHKAFVEEKPVKPVQSLRQESDKKKSRKMVEFDWQ